MKQYAQLLETDPLAMASITSAILAALGCFLGQVLVNYKHRKPATVTTGDTSTDTHTLDLLRILCYFLHGLVYSGPLGHLWFEFLDRTIPFQGAWKTAASIFLDQTFFGPLWVFSFMVFNGFFPFRSFASIWKDIRARYVGIIFAGTKLWTCVHVLTFSVVPLSLRVLFCNVVSVMWAIYLATKTTSTTSHSEKEH